MNKEEFFKEMDYTLGRFNWSNSALDARAISFLNTWRKELNEIFKK